MNNLDQIQWDNKVTELGGSILQSFVWGRFRQTLGRKVYYFSDSDFVNLVEEAPLPMNKKYLYSSRGPLGNAESALADLWQLAEEDHSIIFARLEPMQKLNLPQALAEVQPNNNWMLELIKSEEELLMGMKPKTRYNINLAHRKGVVIREGDKQDLISFWQLMLETSARNKYRLHPQNYYWQMWETLRPNYIKLLMASYQGKQLAAILITLFGDTVTYLHGGSTSSMKEAMAPYLLHWEAIKLVKRLGVRWYDFGGISGNNGKWAGLSRFKKSFGGLEVNYPGTFDLIFSPVWYNVYKNARKLKSILR